VRSLACVESQDYECIMFLSMVVKYKVVYCRTCSLHLSECNMHAASLLKNYTCVQGLWEESSMTFERTA
jgi:hypothetical protein